MASHDFQPRFLGPWAENLNSAPNILLPRPPGSEKVWHDHPALKMWEEKDLAENAFSGSRPDSEATGVQTACPKITCKELVWPWQFDNNKN